MSPEALADDLRERFRRAALGRWMEIGLRALFLALSTLAGAATLALLHIPLRYLPPVAVALAGIALAGVFENRCRTRIAEDVCRTLLPLASAALVPDLLDLRRHMGPGESRLRLDETLAEALAHFHAPTRLDRRHRAELRRLARQSGLLSPTRTVAALLVLAEIGDTHLEDEAYLWSRFAGSTHLGEASREYLAALRPGSA